MAIVLLMIVAVGLVDGVIDPMTPKGACSVSIIPPSPVSISGSGSSGPGGGVDPGVRGCGVGRTTETRPHPGDDRLDVLFRVRLHLVYFTSPPTSQVSPIAMTPAAQGRSRVAAV